MIVYTVDSINHSLTGCHGNWCDTYRSPKLREQAIHVLRDLLASHDSDLRYNSTEARAKIASIYLPLLSVVMDNYQLLYKGADGWEDWTTTFERNTSVRRSVVIRSDSVDGSLEIEQVLCHLATVILCTCVVRSVSSVFLVQALPGH